MRVAPGPPAAGGQQPMAAVAAAVMAAVADTAATALDGPAPAAEPLMRSSAARRNKE